MPQKSPPDAAKLLAALEFARAEFERLNGAGTCPQEIEDTIAEAKRAASDGPPPAASAAKSA